MKRYFPLREILFPVLRSKGVRKKKIDPTTLCFQVTLKQTNKIMEEKKNPHKIIW